MFQIIFVIKCYIESFAETIQNLPEIRKRMDESSRSLFSLWKPTNKHELWVYVSILLI